MAEEVIPEDQLTIFDPIQPWKRKTITNYTIRNLHVPIFENGLCVYEQPSLFDVSVYARQERETFWEEVKRLHYPHNYYVDLSQELYDLRLALLHGHDEDTKKFSK